MKITTGILSSLLALILTFAPSAFAFDAYFSDVQSGHLNFIPIYMLASDGIIQGDEDGSFSPSREVNRAEAIKMILGIFPDFNVNQVSQPEEELFSDTPLTSWYIKYLDEAVNRGMANGYGDNSFKPGDPINLAETLKMIAKAYADYQEPELTEDPFADVSIDDWFGEYAAWAKTRQMLSIDISNKIQPSQKVTRGYLASILYKLKKYGTGSFFGKATYYGAAVQGHSTASGEKFDMNAFTAAHKTLPFGTIVEVTNLANGMTVQVRITDRGPFGPGREIDLTSAAFDQIASLSSGVVNIEYHIIDNATEPDNSGENMIDITPPSPYTQEAAAH